MLQNRKFDSCAKTETTFVFAHVQSKLSYYSSVSRTVELCTNWWRWF